jgi:acyl-CoA thioesterase I
MFLSIARVRDIRMFRYLAQSFGFFKLVLVLIVLTVGPVRAAQINIVAVGASTTAGKRVGLEGAYPAQLESMLRSKGYDVSIRNEGISRDTSLGMLGRIDAAAPAGTSLVLLQIAHSNDGKRGITADQTEVNVKAIVDRLRARNIKVIFVKRRVPSDDIAMDGRHPNADGQKLIAVRLLPQVIAAIGSHR